MSVKIPSELNEVYDTFSKYTRKDYMEIFGVDKSSAALLQNISKRSGETLYNILLETLQKNGKFNENRNPIEQVYNFLAKFDTREYNGLVAVVALKGINLISKSYLEMDDW